MRPPPLTGTRIGDLVTPALLVAMPVLEANEAAMRGLLRGKGVGLRPHAKLHKSEEFARWHMEAAGGESLKGFCAQTVGEAAACLRAGSTDVLLTNSLPRHGALRLAELAAQFPTAKVSALVDCAQHVAVLEDASRVHGAPLGAFVEIECGQDRCGCPPASDTAVECARAIVASSCLRFDGLHVYHGAIQHVRSGAERRGLVDVGPAAAARATIDRLAEAGIQVGCVTGGGTGTLLQDLAAGTHNELQPGSYLFMDRDYGGNEELRGGGGSSAPLFGQALFLHSTVVHANPATGKRVVDCGSKACDFVSGMPGVTSLADADLASRLADVTFKSGGDEHGVLLGVRPEDLPVGATVQLIPSHCDPTVNLHDTLVGVRDGVVERTFRVDARGPG